ncbi:MAG: hypothetical protein PHW75_00555 [Patescibacteria group bacterium]|nr:hypothetical protein [Patescibacteria group bacterium]
MKEQTKKSQITAIAFDILESHPEGVHWVDLNKMILGADSKLHPKTVNGVVWKLSQEYPNKVYKPEKGVFRLLKFR